MTEYRDLWDRLNHVLGKLEVLSGDYARGMAVRGRMAQLENQLGELAEDIQQGFIERRKHSPRRIPKPGWAAARRPAPPLVGPRFGRAQGGAAPPVSSPVALSARPSSGETLLELARVHLFGR